jgi:hypothetical protein
MVIMRACDALGRPSLSDVPFEAIGDRVQALVASGRLMGYGDTTDWRFSEVALPAGAA